VVMIGQGVVVYPAAAPDLIEFEATPERLVAMKWDEKTQSLFASRVQMTAVNRTGSLSIITQTIADFDANITNLSFIQKSDDFCDLTVDVEVRDVDHMNQMIGAIRGSRVVSEANRVIFRADKTES